MEVQNLAQQVVKPVQPIEKKKEPRYASYWKVMLIAINLNLSNIYFGYMLAYISTVQFSLIMTVFKVSLSLQVATGIITGCISFGALLGALIGKKLIHLFSRRNFILFINAIAVVAGSLIYIQNMECLIIMRIIQGACVGLYTSIVPIVVAEISPIQIMGTTGAFTQIFCSVGTTVAYLFYYLLSIGMNPANLSSIWYYVFGFPMITIVIQTLVLLFVFPYQTPKYFLLHHSKTKARALIAQLYKPQYVDEVLNEKIHDLSQALLKQKRLKQSKIVDPQQPVAGQKAPERIPSKVSVNSALSGVESQEPQNAPLSIFTSLHLNTLRQFVGINAVVAYGGSIIKQAVPSLRPIAPFILNFLTFLGAFFSIFLLVRFGRRPILQAGTFVLTVTLIFITVGFFILDSAYTAGTVLIIIGLLVYMFTFGATLGSVIWLYIAEICQPGYIILATALTWIFAVVVIVFFPILKSALPGQSPAYLFLFFLLWTGISFIVNHKVLIETKGKTQIQIQQEFKNMTLCGNANHPSGVAPIPQKPSQAQPTTQQMTSGHHDELSAAVIKITAHNHTLEPIPSKLDEVKV